MKVQDLLVLDGEKDHNNLNFIYMIALLYFGFLFVFFGLIIAALYLIKSSPSKKKEITKKKVEVEDEDTDSEKESVIYKGFSLIPDSIFGISIYVLIILFCIWIFSDFGGECGVDYAPRFFGEC